MKSTLIAILIVAVVILGPFLLIWAVNTLFPLLAIPYTWKTWAAAFLIGGLFKGTK